MKLYIPILKREEEVGKIKDEETMQVYIEVPTWLPHQSVGDAGPWPKVFKINVPFLFYLRFNGQRYSTTIP